MDRDAEFPVTTSRATAGSSCSSIPVTSLSALTASTATRVPNPKASVTASTLTAMPAGLCAESTITTGLRRTTSSRPGAVMAANACRTRSPSSGPVPRGRPPRRPAAHAAFCAWYAPNSGSKIRVAAAQARQLQPLPADGQFPAGHAEIRALGAHRRRHLGGPPRQRPGRRVRLPGQHGDRARLDDARLLGGDRLDVSPR